ncbi:GmrSD restriction endonuclease domain-containing protein [Bacillus velezensis]
MEIKNNSFTVRQLIAMMNKGTLLVDYPIQRPGGQWKNLASSYLMHTAAAQYPIPPMYMLGEKKEVTVQKKGKEVLEMVTFRHVLDGKQRITNFYNFVNNGFKLHKDTPTVDIEGQEYELAGKTFDELDEEVQEMILSLNILCYTIDGETADDDEISDLFYRMNNGAPLSTQQKSKALMGVEWAEIINDLGEHPLIHNLSAFSKAQIRSEAHHSSLIQTMMMLDENEGNYEFKDATQNSLSEYAKTFKDHSDEKMLLVERVREAMDYLLEVLDKKEKFMLKKVHFPMTLITALEAKKMNINGDSFYEWMNTFKNAVDPKSQMEITEFEEDFIPTDYLQYSGKGTTDKKKVVGRMTEMIKHMKAYFEREASNSKQALLFEPKTNSESEEQGEKELEESKETPEVENAE